MHKLLQTLKVYTLIILFIVGWWTFAFKKESEVYTITQHVQASSNRSTLDSAITSIDRNLLKQALAGDSQLMARLIADWDIDAQILNSKGFDNVKRIDHLDFLHSQSLIRILQNEESVKKSAALLLKQNQYVIDDTGNRIDLNQSYKKFLPQTYAAASFLLSLVTPDQIVALPKKLREQVHLYPKSLTSQIPLDIDRHQSEKLFLAKPEIAFVAHYSHPATIQALTNQGVSLYTMKNLTTLPDISKELIHIGNITNKPLQAELLKIFIDAAICAIDNQQTVLIKHFQDHSELPRILVVNYHQTFSVPTAKTITGQLLSRMEVLDISLKYTLDNNYADEWMAPIDKERLLNLNPDFLIVTTENEQTVRKEIQRDQALQKLSAVRSSRLFFVDESIHHSPSQYVVLAYHDLIQALMLP